MKVNHNITTLPPAFACREEPGSDRLATRRLHVFSSYSAQPNDNSIFLEIGPAHNGILKKRDRFNVKIADYLSRSGLVNKYSQFEQYAAENIEDVDYILTPGLPLSDEISDKFDIVIASHVIEHTISLVDFLNDLGALLKQGGQIALVIPDKRFCFDRFRERTSLCSVIDRIGTKRKVHSAGTRAEFIINSVKHRGTTSWATQHHGGYSSPHCQTSTQSR